MTDPNERLTPHFTVREMCGSTSHPEIYNVPPLGEVMDNMRRVCLWLEQLRQTYAESYCDCEDVPLRVSSGYRSQRLNRAVGGSTTSNHLTGCAADIVCRDCQQALRYACLVLDYAEVSGERFDELLLERRGMKYWLHLAVRPTNNRMHVAVEQVKC